MPEITPEMYLDVDALELHGPSALSNQSASPSPAPNLNDIDQVQQALFAAQRREDHAQISLLSTRLDDLLAATPTGKPEAAPEPLAEAPESPQETPEPSSEDKALIESFEASEVLLDLNNTVGEEVVGQVHDWANEHLPEDQLRNYMKMVSSNDPEAVGAFQAMQTLSQQEDAAPDPEGVQPEAFDEDTSSQLVDRFGDMGQVMVMLNQKVTAGEVEWKDVQQFVMSRPQLMQAAVEAKKLGLLNY